MNMSANTTMRLCADDEAAASSGEQLLIEAAASLCASDRGRAASIEQLIADQVETVFIRGVPIVSINIDGVKRLCLAQISNTLLAKYSYNEIHNRRVALGITCMQCTPVQLELLRRVGAMPTSSRRCGMITYREAERLVRSFLDEPEPPKLPRDFAFEVEHQCGWGCKGTFHVARYTSSRAKCVCCSTCQNFFSPNKFIFHFHRGNSNNYKHPDAANFNSWRRHLFLQGNDPAVDLAYAWEDVKAMFNGGNRRQQTGASGTGRGDEFSDTIDGNEDAEDCGNAAESVDSESGAAAVGNPFNYLSRNGGGNDRATGPKRGNTVDMDSAHAADAKRMRLTDANEMHLGSALGYCMKRPSLPIAANAGFPGASLIDSLELSAVFENAASQMLLNSQSRFSPMSVSPFSVAAAQASASASAPAAPAVPWDASNPLLSRFMQSLYQNYQQTLALSFQQQQAAFNLREMAKHDAEMYWGMRNKDKPTDYSVSKLISKH